MATILNSWDDAKPGATAALKARRAGVVPTEAPVEAVEPDEPAESVEATATEEEAVAEESEADAGE
jgi:hypothetical protein|tara:strand:+ start:1445 stop:1642 length:198 start_codon:yes stop_codon:yes gene_type:complete